MPIIVKSRMAVLKLTHYQGATDIRIFVIIRLQFVHIC